MSEGDSARRWYRVKDVLESALERTPADRDAFLTQACGEDSALRAEVESLLSAFDKTEQSPQPAVHPIDAAAAARIRESPSSVVSSPATDWALRDRRMSGRRRHG